MGGMERASANTTNGLDSTGKFEVVFISIFRKEHFFKLNDGVKLIEPIEFNINSLSIHKSVSWIRTIVKKEKPDRILVFNKFYAALAALSIVDVSIPLYVSERSSPLFIWKQPFRMINRIAFNLRPPKGVIAQTSIAASYQKKYFPKSIIKVIPNIVRRVTLYPEIERTNVILAVGRLGDHLKGFDLLLESFALIQDQNWRLHIAGGDENGKDLKDLANKLGILDRVKFLGKIKDIDKVFASAGIYVIPSRSEGFPNALAEAMAAGCCCIAFDFIAGPRDMIEDGVSGIIVENGNISAMANAIDELISKPESRKKLGQAATAIIDRLNSEIITDKIIEFLELK